jgi:excinuclease ABC subunit C
MGVKAYKERIEEIRLFFAGKKGILIKRLEKAMREHAKLLQFEEASEFKRMIFALQHIKDASLIKEEIREHSRRTAGKRRTPFRIEAYDIAHISGTHTVGVMVVLLDGVPHTSSYRKFKIRIDPDRADDTLHLEEILRRRLLHTEWPSPDLVVIDGGTAQKRKAEKLFREMSLSTPIVSVVKDDKHKAKAILGPREVALSYKRPILVANLESHRFAVAYHRLLRDRVHPLVPKSKVRQ